MALKYGFVFWFTSTFLLLLFSSSQMLTVEGLDCDICTRFTVVYSRRPCARMPCNSREDANTAGQRIVQDAVELMEKLQNGPSTEFMSRVLDDSKQTSQSMMERGGGSSSFVCVKGLFKVSIPEVGDQMMTMAGCATFNQARPPQAQPYAKVPEVELLQGMQEGITKQLWYICDEKNGADCRVDEAGDKVKLETVVGVSRANGRLQSTDTVWILITFSCLITARAVRGDY